MAEDYLNYVPGVAAGRALGLDPRQPYEQAQAGAKEAQGQANALSSLQWQRQMQGLGGALGYANNLQQLYNSIYSPGGGAPAAGGGPTGGPSQSEMMGLSGPPPQAAAPPQQGLGDALKGAWDWAKNTDMVGSPRWTVNSAKATAGAVKDSPGNVAGAVRGIGRRIGF